jgi:hypothetical protein
MNPSHFRTMKRHLPIMILILVNILIGIAIVRDYGESWDEQSINVYAKSSMRAYPVFFLGGRTPYLGESSLINYGPAFSMAQVILTQGLRAVFPSWSVIDGWHFSYFIAFQIGILSLYFLSKKWMNQWAAFGTTLLFSTQPVLWGHAFINPKDIPFMAFFLASITMGIYMVDAVPTLITGRHPQTEEIPPPKWKEEWNNASPKAKKGGIAFSIIYLLPILFMLTGLSQKLVADLISYLYHADKQSSLGAWFTKFAANANRLPVTNYIHKAQTILSWFEIGFVLIGLGIGIWIFGRVFPLRFQRISKAVVLPFIKGILFNPLFLGAGLVLGFTTSIRILGPLAGGIVMVYAFYKSWKKAIVLLIPYTLISLLVMYLTWPYLWGNVVNHFIESITVMAHYPWHGLILFRGVLTAEKDLPRYFIPYLMAIQLTEVMPPLFIIGLVYSAWRALKGNQKEPFILIVFWFILPLSAVIIIGSTVYDNFRQLLFLLPPIFLAGGIVLEIVFKKVTGNAFRFLILCVLVFPGVYADIDLHPYQYVYYNSYVGGVRGAFRKYELDYWGTSFRQAAQYVNETAPLNAQGVVLEPMQPFQDFARPDLKLYSLSEVKPDQHYDFLVASDHKNEDQALCRSVDPALTISRDGAILAVVKVTPFSSSECP